MKKITLIIAFLISSTSVIGQVLNEDANWPNSNWDLDGSFDDASNIFTGNPTIVGGSSSFSYDEDEAGGSSINNIGVQSPTINLVNAFNAGETALTITSTYVLNVYTDESLNIQYWDQDATSWVNWGPIYTNNSSGDVPTVDFCSGERAVFNPGELDISGFSNNQLQNFRYRIYYDDNGAYGWGVCFDSPNISSVAPPNCPNISDLSICIITDSSANISWSAGSNEIAWEIAVTPQGSGAPTSGTPTSSNDSYSVTGLSASTGYEVYVRGNCLDGSGFSSWISMPFTTNATSPTPGAFIFTQDSSISMSGTSYAAVDMNNDGLDDLVAATSSNVRIAYQTTNGCFDEAIYTASTTYGPGWSIAAGDLNKDGYNDLLYGAGNGVSFLTNNGDGTGFTNSFNTVASADVFSQRSNFIDINNDGNLDAFVCHDVEPNVYFINDGSGAITYYQGASSILPNGLGTHANGGNYGTVWIDYDNDGDMDMFIAKCRGGNITHKINELWQNQGVDINGNVTFINVADLGHYAATFPTQGHNNSSGLGDPVQTWSSAWADYDNDGDLDVYVGASSSSDGSHKYMLNNGDGTFSNATSGAGFDSAPYGIENAPADFNNDGYVDILSNGNILLNDGDNTFTLVSANMPPSGAIGDVNDDGFLDVFRQNMYLNNGGNGNNWIKIRPQGILSNSNGIGARLEIVTALGTQIREIRSGEGFEYMSTLFAHFGIGTDTEITSLTIKWPSGTVDVILNPAINETITVAEGDYPLSVNNNSLEGDLVIYPNPAKDIVNINASVELNNATYTIYDITGKQILNADLIDKAINVSKLNTGIYILQITVDGKQKTQKLIKQ
ncbi:FG-GAP-like repeat-containing protein [Oceanihabitans sp. 2_MG-2023]|uniref:FG-GAP-like repeat-containing protein n=1 Tax=Oceanihabitans sp. 2_MG-2023 TaxID=3062661 RepID=UPI0026E12E5B|nr:FG-GAP-like repeat-containing protein [Oceanihabitans sp. 2_MG-2023]MDO6595791.1 FG-GAP-like repeat-containing protein [Oceanihabitans sp. 2_MG-2023]